MSEKKVAVLVGSLRKGSLNRMMAKELMNLAPPSLKMEMVEIGQLPLFNQDEDVEGKAPPAWTVFREKMKGFDAILFVTPEYNRSVPAALKNALDVGSQPYGKSIWGGKRAGIISVSPGTMGGFGANHHLRQSLVFLDVPAMQQPEAYMANAGNMFDTNGKIDNENTRAFAKKFIDAFAKWVE